MSSGYLSDGGGSDQDMRSIGAIGAIDVYANILPGVKEEEESVAGAETLKVKVEVERDTPGLTEAEAPTVVGTREERGTRLHRDPNIRFVTWVAGHAAINDIRKLMLGVYSSGALTFLTQEYVDKVDVRWGRGVHRISDAGAIQMTPQFVSARDAAFRSITSMGDRLLPARYREPLNPRSDTRMSDMIEEPHLNELFARLTAVLYQQMDQGNPRRYVTGAMRSTTAHDERSVYHEFKRYFKKRKKRNRQDPLSSAFTESSGGGAAPRMMGFGPSFP
jgi:hypothetical protein